MLNRPAWSFTPAESSQRRSMAWTAEDVPTTTTAARTSRLLSQTDSIMKLQRRQRSLSDATGASHEEELEDDYLEESRRSEGETPLPGSLPAPVTSGDESAHHVAVSAAGSHTTRDDWLWSPRVTIAEPVQVPLNDDYLEVCVRCCIFGFAISGLF